jgi:anti-sigma regulatory factor (Ser/Thr protein kinase)
MAMTAHPLSVASSPVSDVGLHWLTSAVQMAASANGNWPLAAGPGGLDWACFPRVATRTQDPDARSVRAARDVTVATLQRWGVAAERRDDIAVVVSELLTNALRHATSRPADIESCWPIQLGLVEFGSCVLSAVADPSDKPPLPQDPGELAETGRGLHVIEALSDAWGYTTPSDLGKVVWALFSIEPGLAAADADPCLSWPVRHVTKARR